MAEAFGIASGVAGLVSLTIEVFGISYKYVHGVRNAASSVRQFLVELEHLQKVLHRVEQVAEETDEREVFGDAGPCLLTIKESNEYIGLLVDVRDKLQSRQTPSSVRNKLKALTWPFSEKETLDLVSSLHRHLDIYNGAVTVDTRTYVRRSAEDEHFSAGRVRPNFRCKLIAHVVADSQNEKILEWLSPLNMYQKQQDIISTRRGTIGSWLLTDPVFQKWIDDKYSERSLWCPGDPGSGKTVIASIVIDYLLNNFANEDTKVVYIYCSYKDQAAQTAFNLIACLARQIIGRPKALPQELTLLHEELQEKKRRPSLNDLQRLLVAMCNKYERTYLVVDALDECEASNERRLLLPVLESLPYRSTRLFATSRPNSEDIVQTFGKANQIAITASVQDLRDYILERMNERPEFLKKLTPQLKERIMVTFSNGASGMFLLTALQMNRIFDTRTTKEIKSALSSISGKLDEVYRDALVRIQEQAGNDGKLGMRILSWIIHAKRPLTVNELRYGLAVEYSDVPDHLEDFDEDNLLSPGDVVDVCAGLVIIDSTSQVVRLVHYTTQEYFDKERVQLFKGAEVDISRACLTYISYSVGKEVLDMKTGNKLVKSHPFLNYACNQWFSHAKNVLFSEDADSRFVNAIVHFKNSDSITFSVYLLWLLSGHFSTFRTESPDKRGEAYPYEVASELGLKDLLDVLLDRRLGPHPNLDSSLIAASNGGHVNTARLLLQHGAAIDATPPYNNYYGRTKSALEVACREGNIAMVELLVENGADINGRNTPLTPPIHAAALSNSPAIIDLLLKKGVNVNARNSRGETACHQAVTRDFSIESTRRLIDAGCDLELRDNDGDTVLLACNVSSNPNVVRLLLDGGADACAKNMEGKKFRNIIEDNFNLERLDKRIYYYPGYRPQNPEQVIEMLRQAEQKSSTTTANQPQQSNSNSSGQTL